jgi:cytochrome bd-type quinol oxidase subunit 1
VEIKPWALIGAIYAVISFAAFVWLQLASIDSKDFSTLIFSSFFFLAVATVLALLIYRGSSNSQKALAAAVCIILIIGTIFVTDSFTQNPRGGGDVSTQVTMENFDLDIQGEEANGKLRYRGSHTEAIHKPSYASSLIYLSTADIPVESHVGLTLMSPANVNGTCYIFFILDPYESNPYALLKEEVAFTEHSTSQAVTVDVFPIWGDDAHVRFEGYTIEFRLRLTLTGAETGPSALNFTVTPDFEVHILEAITSTTFQNNLTIALCGVFIGTNLLVPGAFAFHLLSRRQKRKD